MAVMRLNFLSKTLGMHTNVTIILPTFDQGFDIGKPLEEIYPKDAKYKVLWLLHGGSGDDADYLNWTNVSRFSVEYNCAIVCMNSYNSAYTDYPRGAKYYTFLVDELRAFCYANLPFSDKREDNFVGGLSMGSGGAMKVAMDRCEEFSAAIIMSGGIAPKGGNRGHSAFRERIIASGWPMPKQPSDAIRPNLDEMMENNVKQGRPLPKIFIACGEDDNIAYEAATNAVKVLPALGYDVTGFFLPGYRHEWDFWEICMKKAFADWLQLPHREVTEEAAATIAPTLPKGTELKK